jgi:hypothetical protein
LVKLTQCIHSPDPGPELSLSLRQKDNFGMGGKNLTNLPRYLTAITLRKGENKNIDNGLTIL